MAALTPAQQRRIDGILDHLGEYMDLRFAHAERVNPRVGGFIDDLRAQLLSNVRVVLNKGKAWGGEKYMIADVLCGDDASRRYDVLNSAGQYSVMHEIIQSGEDAELSDQAARVNFLTDVYRSLDPSLGQIVILAQNWLWWDLPDASLLQVFRAQTNVVQRLRSAEINEQMVNHYRPLLGLPPGEDVTLEIILAHHLQRLERVLTEFELRRRDDLAHEQIWRREVIRTEVVNEMITELATEIQALAQLEKTDEYSDQILDHYSQRLGVTRELLERDRILSWQRQHVETIQQRLLSARHTGKVLGPPHNFKESQLETMRGEIERLREMMPTDLDEAQQALDQARERREAQRAATSTQSDS